MSYIFYLPYCVKQAEVKNPKMAAHKQWILISQSQPVRIQRSPYENKLSEVNFVLSTAIKYIDSGVTVLPGGPFIFSVPEPTLNLLRHWLLAKVRGWTCLPACTYYIYSSKWEAGILPGPTSDCGGSVSDRCPIIWCCRPKRFSTLVGLFGGDN